MKDWVLYSWTSLFFRTLHSHVFSSVHITLRLERKSGYYLITLLVPVIMLALLGPLVFVLPVESGEKIGFALTILLSLSVVMTILSDHIPPISTQTCLLSTYRVYVQPYPNQNQDYYFSFIRVYLLVVFYNGYTFPILQYTGTSFQKAACRWLVIDLPRESRVYRGKALSEQYKLHTLRNRKILICRTVLFSYAIVNIKWHSSFILSITNV